MPALGTSGAIAGIILGCYTQLFPLARVVVVVPILFLPLFFEVPAIVFIGIWIAIQLVQDIAVLLMPSTGEGIAWWAHIGGFLAGLIFGPLLVQSRRQYRAYYPDGGIPSGKRGVR